MISATRHSAATAISPAMTKSAKSNITNEFYIRNQIIEKLKFSSASKVPGQISSNTNSNPYQNLNKKNSREPTPTNELVISTCTNLCNSRDHSHKQQEKQILRKKSDANDETDKSTIFLGNIKHSKVLLTAKKSSPRLPIVDLNNPESFEGKKIGPLLSKQKIQFENAPVIQSPESTPRSQKNLVVKIKKKDTSHNSSSNSSGGKSSQQEKKRGPNT